MIPVDLVEAAAAAAHKQSSPPPWMIPTQPKRNELEYSENIYISTQGGRRSGRHMLVPTYLQTFPMNNISYWTNTEQNMSIDSIRIQKMQVYSNWSCRSINSCVDHVLSRVYRVPLEILSPLCDIINRLSARQLLKQAAAARFWLCYINILPPQLHSASWLPFTAFIMIFSSVYILAMMVLCLGTLL